MPRNRTSQREWERKKKRMKRGGLVPTRNQYGILDLTPFNADLLLRGKSEKTVTNSTWLIKF